MRWLFLGLIIINAFYFVWIQQDFQSNTQSLQVDAKKGQVEYGQVSLLNETSLLGAQSPDKKIKSSQAEAMLLGGFSDEESAQKLQQRLLSLDIKSEFTTLDNQVDIEYWVYLEPLASRQASVRQLKELQARKIDGYLITQGDLTNGISLGMFAREDSAQGVAERMSAAGYEPSIRAVERSQRLYWVVVDAGVRRLVDQALLQQLVEDFPDMKHLLMPHEKIKD